MFGDIACDVPTWLNWKLLFIYKAPLQGAGGFLAISPGRRPLRGLRPGANLKCRLRRQDPSSVRERKCPIRRQDPHQCPQEKMPPTATRSQQYPRDKMPHTVIRSQRGCAISNWRFIFDLGGTLSECDFFDVRFPGTAHFIRRTRLSVGRSLSGFGVTGWGYSTSPKLVGFEGDITEVIQKDCVKNS